MSLELKIIRMYDNELATLPHVTELVKNTSSNRGGFNRIYQLHDMHVNKILGNIVNPIAFFTNYRAKKYIKKPKFSVSTQLYNPAFKEEIDNPISMESALFITPLLEYCSFIDYHQIDNDNLAKMVYKVISTTYITEPEKKFYNYLDSGLIKIGIILRKVIVGPGKYMLKYELVPVGTIAFMEIAKRLIRDYQFKYGIIPDKEMIKYLESKAISLACDMPDEDNNILENPFTFKSLNTESYLLDNDGIKLYYRNSKKIVEDFLLSSDVAYIRDWQQFKKEMFNLYGIKWDDVIVDNISKKKINVWHSIKELHYDNRLDYTLEEQFKIYCKKSQFDK